MRAGCTDRSKAGGRRRKPKNPYFPAVMNTIREGTTPLPEPVRPLGLGRFGRNLVRGRIGDLKCRHFRSAINYPGQGLQDFRIFLSVVSFRVFFLIPETNGYCLITFWGDEGDLILKSLLLAEHGNHLV